MQVEFLDWPAVAAIVGIASTIGAYWLQNHREEREEKNLTKRIHGFEEKLDKLDELGRVHDKLLVKASAWMAGQDDLTKGLVESTDAQLKADDDMAEASAAQDKLIEALTKRMDADAEAVDRLLNDVASAEKSVGEQAEVIDVLTANVDRGRKRATKIRDRQSGLIGATLFVVEKLEQAERRRGASTIHRDHLAGSIDVIEGLRDEPDESWVVRVEPQPVDDPAQEDS